jgi:hypothetical protein
LKALLTKHEYAFGVSVYDVDELRVPGIESDKLRHSLKKRFGWIQTRYSSQLPKSPGNDGLARVSGDVRAQGVPNDVEVARVATEFELQVKFNQTTGSINFYKMTKELFPYHKMFYEMRHF